jgi:hypothetical protein
MVLVKVVTALQDDYDLQSDFEVPLATAPSSGAKTNPPILSAVADANGSMNVFFTLNSSSFDQSKPYNAYFDPTTRAGYRRTPATYLAGDHLRSQVSYKQQSTRRQEISPWLSCAMTARSSKCSTLPIDIPCGDPRLSRLLKDRQSHSILHLTRLAPQYYVLLMPSKHVTLLEIGSY